MPRFRASLSRPRGPLEYTTVEVEAGTRRGARRKVQEMIELGEDGDLEWWYDEDADPEPSRIEYIAEVE